MENADNEDGGSADNMSSLIRGVSSYCCYLRSLGDSRTQVFTQEVAILYKQRYWCDRRDFIYTMYIRDNANNNAGCLKKFPEVVK